MTDVTFRLYASRPAADTYLRVVGGHPALGGWSPATAPGLMVPTADGDDDAPAVVTVSLPPGETVEYKYARVDAVARTVTWEGADNRRLVVAPGAAIVDHWEGGESPALPCEGIVVPPPPPAVGSTAAPALTEEAAAAPLTADASAPLADAPAPAADASTSLADAPARASAGTPMELTAANIDAVLDEVRPYLLSDGGNISVVSVDAATAGVVLRLEGACGSCASSTTTMKMGVERVLREAWPDLGDVTAVTDAAGAAFGVAAVEAALDNVRGALRGLGGSVSCLSASADGQVVLLYAGPPKLAYGIELMLRDSVPGMTGVTFTDDDDDDE